jgi:hypothetical protein
VSSIVGIRYLDPALASSLSCTSIISKRLKLNFLSAIDIGDESKVDAVRQSTVATYQAKVFAAWNNPLAVNRCFLFRHTLFSFFFFD